MKMTDEIRIEASREQVFAALNDPDILRQAIPGCQDLEQTSATELTATVQAKVGPVKAKFQGSVILSDINPPESYTISGAGKGGAAGFAKGRAQISLIEDGTGTRLSYEVDAEVGGKLAQVGGRLIEATSKKLAGEFFKTFSALVGSVETIPDTPASAPAPTTALSTTPAPSAPPLLWAEAALIAALLVVGFMG